MATVALSGSASASPSFEGKYVLAGPTLGASLARDGQPAAASFLLGGEVSAVRATPSLWWYGLYADGVYDWGGDEGRFSIGPEFGWLIFGLDAGYLWSTTARGGGHGLSLRPVVTMGLLGAYYRFGWIFADSDRFGEAGVLLKLPLVTR